MTLIFFRTIITSDEGQLYFEGYVMYKTVKCKVETVWISFFGFFFQNKGSNGRILDKLGYQYYCTWYNMP